MLKGAGTPEVLSVLASAQQSRHLLLFRGLLDAVRDEAADNAVTGYFWDNFQALCAIESNAPWEIADLLAHPHVGAWLATCLRRVMNPQDRPIPLWVDLGHLGAIAVAAAIRADVEVEATVPARLGTVVIPTVGCLNIGSIPEWQMTQVRRLADGTLIVASDRKSVIVPLGEFREGEDWWPVRRLSVSCEGLTFEVELDDLDPYRSIHPLQTTGRLTEDEVEEWAENLASAWAILVTRHRACADSLVRGLRTLVPLAVPGSGWASSTSRHAPAAVALNRPRNGASLACTLVHEFQHTQLNLIMDIAPLHRDIDGPLYYSPWRDDPRPLTGVIHGLCAGVAVADFWRVEHEAGYLPAVAAVEFARTRRQVEIALNTLAASNSLTDTGAALAAAVNDVITSWANVTISTRCLSLGNDLTVDHEIRWKLGNLKPMDNELRLLTACWRAGIPPSRLMSEPVLRAPRSPFTHDVLLRLAYTILHEEGDDYRGEYGFSPDRPEVTESDFILLTGRYEAAVSAYELEIRAGNRPIEAWAGLAVALQRLMGPGSRAVISRPELVRAFYDQLATGSNITPAPRDVVRWLTPAVGASSRRPQSAT
jgi:HEXXH motif-containing protein